MAVRSFDPIDILEAAYARPENRRMWFLNVLESLGEPLSDGFPSLGYRVQMGVHAVLDLVCTDESVADAWGQTIIAGVGSPQRRAEVARVDPMGLFCDLEIFSSYRPFFEKSRDSYALAAADGESHLNVFCLPLLERRTVPDDVRPLWRRVAVHLGAASRLLDQTGQLDDPEVEAILEPDGRVVHLAAEAQDKDAKEMLRACAKNIDRARTRRERGNPEASLDLWTGLLLGRWSLVDHFDSDGRRYSIARKNDPSRPELNDLSRRERQVAFYVSIGLSNKHVAYALGLAESTVATHLAHCLSKLGLVSRAQLIELAAQSTS